MRSGLWRFAAGLELLHTFLLIHDDVVDQAELRRGGEALHRMLAPWRKDHHEGALLALGLQLERQCWRVTMLGADTPSDVRSRDVEDPLFRGRAVC